MAFYLNLNSGFSIDDDIKPDGAIILACSSPLYQLSRRKIDKKYPYMRHRLFDPQLYMAGLDAHESPNTCFNLATYPWFGVKNLPEYDSKVHSQRKYKKDQFGQISKIWSGQIPENEAEIDFSVSQAIEIQLKLSCEGIILPSPLTDDPSTDYSKELIWLDSGLKYIKKQNIKEPVYASLVLADVCVRNSEPQDNSLLSIIVDSLSAREINGVYIVFEQRTETDETRYLGNTRALWSALELVHRFTNESRLETIVNFFGPFGLALAAAGARIWASNWYKSLVRLRLADKIAGGRAFPLYWSFNIGTDIHLKQDFDKLVASGFLSHMSDVTIASEGLLRAARLGNQVSNIPDWQYGMGNVTAAINHYKLSAINANGRLKESSNQLDFIQNWLEHCANESQVVQNILGQRPMTKMSHIGAWSDAFKAYRRAHNV